MLIGDIVIIADNQHSRDLWPKYIVQQLYRGANNVVRSAELRTYNTWASAPPCPEASDYEP